MWLSRVPLLVLLYAAPTLAQSPNATRWIANGSALADFTIAADTAQAHGGHVSLRVTASDDPTGFAGALTILPAAPYAGHRITVSAVIRTASLGGGGAALWTRADSGDGRAGGNPMVAFASTQGHRFLAGTLDWTPVAVTLDVPTTATRLFFGVLSMGRGTLWFDDVRVEPASGGANAAGDTRELGFEPPDVLVSRVVETGANSLARSPREAARVITSRGLENVVAFTRLVGYVRFWYPGDSVLSTNWDDFTVRGMRDVEQAPTADSLASTLRALVASVAPTVAVYRAGARPPTPHRDTGQTRGIVFWEHCGYGVPRDGAAPENAYASTRRYVAAPGGRPASEVTVTDCGPPRRMPVPDPTQPFVADLGGGVSASIPLALYTASPAPDVTWQPRTATERFSLDDRATRLADVALLWMVPQHFYPYFDVVHTDWAAALPRALGEAATDTGAAPFDGTLERLVAALHDGHGNAIRSGVVRAAPGIALGWVENRVVVTAAGDSATAAGVRAGDELLAIDGRPIGDTLRAAEAQVSGATPQWIRYKALSQIALGIPGAIVTLRLRDPLTPGAQPRDVRLTRVMGSVPSEPRPDEIAELRPGIFYVDLGRVSDADIAQALPHLETARGIVFDMRGYPSHVSTPAILAHLADSTIHSARFEVPLVLRPDHAEMRFAGDGWAIPPQQPRWHARVAFITGGGAISYAESTMGVVEENHLGAIVGETTAGTNGNINPFELPGGYTVIWTGMRVQKRNGTPHHGVGIQPTIPVSPTLRGVRAGVDETLARALDVVSTPER